MAKALRLTAEQRDDLVAYLDGELEESQTQYIDQVLARSEVARHEVEALARTWELLDLLPKPNATEGFTDRTITTLKVSEMATPLTEQPWFDYVRKGTIAAGWVLLLSVCAAVGFVITTQAVPNEQAELLTELPLIRNLDVYLEIEDLEFVRELQRSTQFTRTVTAEAEPPPETAGSRTLAKSPLPTDRAGLSERYQMVAEMPQTDRDRVQRNWELFRQMTPERQAHFRALHQQYTEQPEAVQTLLKTYAAWLPTLSPGKRDDLRQAGNSAQRLDLIRKFKDEQDNSREIQVFDLNLDLQRWKQRVPPGPYLSQPELVKMLDLVERKLLFAERRKLDQQGKLLPLERLARVLQATFSPGSHIVDPQTVRDLLEMIEDETERQKQERIPPEFQRGALARLIVNSLFKQISDRQVEFFPTESQLEQVFVAQQGEERYKLMQKSPHDLTRELLVKYWEEHGSDEARRLARIRSELWDFWGKTMNYGPRPPGFGDFRDRFKDDRNKDGDRGKDGDRRPPRGGSEGGRPPEPPPKTDPR